MHPFFKSLAFTNTPSLHAFFMDIHHNTSFKSMLEDDSISLAFRICIHSYLGKGARLWLIAKPFIYSFHIAHFTFTSMLHFPFGLIQPLALLFSRVNVDMG